MQREIAHNLEAGERRTKDVAPGKVKTFPELNLRHEILLGLQRRNFVTPTMIQAAAIPMALSKKDLLVQSKSGTGKTLIYVIAALQGFNASIKTPQALVVVPTRELAVQVQEIFAYLGEFLPKLKASYFIGGTDFISDRKRMDKCNIVVGTPGRLLHLYQRQVLCVSNLTVLVLDEADQLYQSGRIRKQVSELLRALPAKIQKLACSATYEQNLDEQLAKMMDKPVLISNSKRATVLLGIRQFVYELPKQINNMAEMNCKLDAVSKIFEVVPYQQVVLFASSKMRADSFRNYLARRGVECHLISGAMSQEERSKVFDCYRFFTMRTLVATDVFARGVDSPHTNLIVNLDPPRDHVDYLHRIGRAGRFGSKGIAITLVYEGTECDRFKGILSKAPTGKSVLEFPKAPSKDVNFWNFKTYDFPYFIPEEDTQQEADVSEKGEALKDDLKKDDLKEDDVSTAGGALRKEEALKDGLREEEALKDDLREEEAPKDDLREDEDLEDDLKDDLKEEEASKDDLKEEEASKDDLKEEEASKDDLKEKQPPKDDLREEDALKDYLKEEEGAPKNDLKEGEAPKDDLKEGEALKNDLKEKEALKDDLKEEEASKDDLKEKDTSTVVASSKKVEKVASTERKYPKVDYASEKKDPLKKKDNPEELEKEQKAINTSATSYPSKDPLLASPNEGKPKISVVACHQLVETLQDALIEDKKETSDEELPEVLLSEVKLDNNCQDSNKEQPPPKITLNELQMESDIGKDRETRANNIISQNPEEFVSPELTPSSLTPLDLTHEPSLSPTTLTPPAPPVNSINNKTYCLAAPTATSSMTLQAMVMSNTVDDASSISSDGSMGSRSDSYNSLYTDTDVKEIWKKFLINKRRLKRSSRNKNRKVIYTWATSQRKRKYKQKKAEMDVNVCLLPDQKYYRLLEKIEHSQDILKRLRRYSRKSRLNNLDINLFIRQLYDAYQGIYGGQQPRKCKECEPQNKLTVHVTHQMNIPAAAAAAVAAAEDPDFDSNASEATQHSEEFSGDEEEFVEEEQQDSSSGFVESNESASSGIDTSEYGTKSSSDEYDYQETDETDSYDPMYDFELTAEEIECEEEQEEEDEDDEESNVSLAATSYQGSVSQGSDEEQEPEDLESQMEDLEAEESQMEDLEAEESPSDVQCEAQAIYQQMFKTQYQFIISHVASHMARPRNGL